MSVLRERRAPDSPDEPVLALNYATLAIVDEILWLPSPELAIRAVTLLYGAADEKYNNDVALRAYLALARPRRRRIKSGKPRGGQA